MSVLRRKRGAESSGRDPVSVLPGAILDGEVLLRVRALSRSFNGVQAVREVSFDVAQGEIVSIIGPNGSGKSSTMNLLTGLLRADSGTIALDGKDIVGHSQEEINRLGVSRTFQNGRVFAAMSVRDNVFVGAYARHATFRPLQRLLDVPVLRWIPMLGELAKALFPTRAVRLALAEVDREVDSEIARFGERLEGRVSDPAFTLSYANRRRTEIARTLIQRPRLLLLDEPTAGMNQTETAEVLEQLQALKNNNQTIVLVEHKIDLVMELSDRVLVLDGGELISAGTPSEVQRDERVIEAYLGSGRLASKARALQEVAGADEDSHV
jgi:branched-chain amino acid transport system ATP-binding protein